MAVILAKSTDGDAQDRRPQQTTRPPAQQSNDPEWTGNPPLVEPNEDYRISPGDIVDILIDRAPELSGTFRVGANGTILMQYLGRVTVREMTQDDLAVFISDSLRGRYLKNPRVTVNVKQINSHSFFIQGAVNRPGVYQIEGRPSLFKLITVAGGLTENHGSTAFLIRETKQTPTLARTGGSAQKHQGDQPIAKRALPAPVASPSTEYPTAGANAEDESNYELISVNISGLFKGRFDQNTFIEPGTLVNIPPTDVFFVAGEVHAPGSFPLKEGTTLRQAISLAQGTSFKAATSRGVIYRDDPNSGARQEIKVDINAVMTGKKEDVPIFANDIIIVPNSRFKSVGGTLLTAFGVSAARLPRVY